MLFPSPQINGQDLTDAAFCFAAETLRNYANAPNVKITVVNTPGMATESIAFRSFQFEILYTELSSRY